MFKKILIIALFCLGIVYFGTILAVGIHEIFGHGLAYEIMGHDFVKFDLFPDGMGHAYGEYAYDPSPMEQVFILLAGPISTYIFSIIFLGLGWCFRRRFWWAMSFYLLGLMNLMDGGPYMLWSSFVNIGNGDFARALIFIPEFRTVFLILGGLMTIGGIVFVNILFYRNLLFKWFGDLGTKRWIIIAVLFLSQSVAWFGFDWNQLAPGVNYLPQITGIITAFFTLLYVGIANPKTDVPNEEIKWHAALSVSLILAVVTLLATLIWFRHGVNIPHTETIQKCVPIPNANISALNSNDLHGEITQKVEEKEYDLVGGNSRIIEKQIKDCASRETRILYTINFVYSYDDKTLCKPYNIRVGSHVIKYIPRWVDMPSNETDQWLKIADKIKMDDSLKMKEIENTAQEILNYLKNPAKANCDEVTKFAENLID